MQNPQFDSHSIESFIADFQQDHDVLLTGTEEMDTDSYEHAHLYGDKLVYSYTPVVRTTFTATGFVWTHPNGATISGNFAKPIKAYEEDVDQDGDVLSNDSYETRLRAAIVAKCGRISGFADSLLN